LDKFRYLGGIATASVVALVAASAVRSAPTSSARDVVTRHHGGWMARGANPKHPWLYVSGYTSNNVAIYDIGRFGFPKVGEISEGVSGPAGLAVDSSGSLYVANQTGSITIYPAGTTSPSLTLSQGLYSPQGVAVDVNGDVYVANRGPSPSIVVYAQGQSTPYETITSDLIQVPTQMEFDAQRNLYISDDNTLANELPFGSQQVESLDLQYMTGGGGLARDAVTGDLFLSGVGGNGTHSFWRYAPGNLEPVRSFNGGSGADTLAVANIRGRRYVVVPDGFDNTVSLYDEGKKNPLITFATSVKYLVGVTVKPAGIP